MYFYIKNKKKSKFFYMKVIFYFYRFIFKNISDILKNIYLSDLFLNNSLEINFFLPQGPILKDIFFFLLNFITTNFLNRANV